MIRAVSRRVASGLGIGAQWPLTLEGIEVIVGDRAKQAGIRHVKPHLMRHTAAVMTICGGMDALRLMQAIGLTNLDTTRQYLFLAHIYVGDAHRRHSPVERLKR